MLLQHATTADIEIKLTKKTCLISNSVKKDLHGSPHLPDKGYGLGKLIVERICSQHQWHYKAWLEHDHYFVEIRFTEL